MSTKHNLVYNITLSTFECAARGWHDLYVAKDPVCLYK